MAFLDRALSAVGLRPRSQVAVGEPAPDFTLFDTEGQAVSLRELLDRGPAILAFYPRAFTSGCTHELRSYAQHEEELAAKGAQLCAISVDDRETLARFRTSLGASFRFPVRPRRRGGAPSTAASRAAPPTASPSPSARTAASRSITSGLSAIFPGADIEDCPITPRR